MCSCTDSLLFARGCESHEFFLYLLLMPYFLHPKHSSFFIIFATEIKAEGQLHFKYYTEVKGLQRMYTKTSAQKFTDPLEGNVLYWLPSLQNIQLWCVCSLFCFPVQLHVTTLFFFYHVKDVVGFLCLLCTFFFFFTTPS